MDQPDLSTSDHRHALRGLARIHRFTGIASRLWREISRAGATFHRPLHVLDVGCGDGELLRCLAQLAKQNKRRLILSGLDVSPTAVSFAAEACKKQNIEAKFSQVDVVNDTIPFQADVVICSLFLHHFDEPTVLLILDKIAAAAEKMALIEDLKRSRLGFALSWAGTRLLSRSRIVHVDGLLSVQAAFSIPEISRIVDRSKL